MRLSHIDKIITTYRERKTEDKYSYVAPLHEVKDNDYNLNIPRYVDTFEKEETVNLQQVADQLKALETEIQTTDTQIADYCKQLGIATPF